MDNSMSPEEFAELLRNRRSPRDFSVRATDDGTRTLLLGYADDGALSPARVHIYQYRGELHRVVYEGDQGREIAYAHNVTDEMDLDMISIGHVYDPAHCDAAFAGLFDKAGFSLEFEDYRARRAGPGTRSEGILAFADDPELDGQHSRTALRR